MCIKYEVIGPFNFCFASLVTKLPSVTESKWSAVVNVFVQDPVVYLIVIWQQTKSSINSCSLSICINLQTC